jgi:hypothetical protein
MTENGNLIHTRRWYDNISDMTMALLVSKQLPPEIQLVIARHLNGAIDDYRRLKRSDKNAISLGQNRVMGLYKSSNRLRWYDPKPELHRAFTLMATVPDFFLIEFAQRILTAGRFIQEQQAYGNFGDRYQLADTVEGILMENTISIEESGGGIKLVSSQEFKPDQTRHIVPVNPRRKNPD